MKQVLSSFFICLAWLQSASVANFATEMLDATFKLYHADSTGTCLLVSGTEQDKNLFLVTAAHVLEGTKGDTAIVVLRKKHEDGSYHRHDHTISIRRDGKPLWVRHSKTDVAVLKLSDPPPVPVKALPLTRIADEAALSAAELHICSPLFVLTYPQRIEANSAGFAVARSGIISSQPFLPIERHQTYMAEFTTFAGDSGGPTFVAGKDGHPLLIGIVIAQLRHDEKIKSAYEERMIHYPLGLGTVLHAQFIRETIDAAAK